MALNVMEKYLSIQPTHLKTVMLASTYQYPSLHNICPFLMQTNQFRDSAVYMQLNKHLLPLLDLVGYWHVSTSQAVLT